MNQITVEWLSGMVAEALVARGLETTAEQEAVYIERWLNETIRENEKQICQRYGHHIGGGLFDPHCMLCGEDL